jgi:hypothetical protein
MVISRNNPDLQMPQNHKESNLQAVAQLLRFRQELHDHFTHRPLAIMNLLDALSSNTEATSVAQLSLNPCFRHQYSSVYDGIDNFFTASHSDDLAEQRLEKERQLMGLILPHLQKPKQRDFWLFCLDVTPAPRPFANTLADRTYVYQPNVITSNKPVTIGHQYAALVHLPEKESLSTHCRHRRKREARLRPSPVVNRHWRPTRGTFSKTGLAGLPPTIRCGTLFPLWQTATVNHRLPNPDRRT